MKFIFLLFATQVIHLSGMSQIQNEENLVKQTVYAWFNSFNKHDYTDYPAYTSESCYGINPLGAHGKRTSETPAMYNKAHETLLKNVTINIDSMIIRFIKPDVAIATVFSSQKGVLNIPNGMDKNIFACSSDKLISTMVTVKVNDKWLITHYQNAYNFIEATR